MQQMCSINDINYKLLDIIFVLFFYSKENKQFFCLDLFSGIIIFPLNKSFPNFFFEKKFLIFVLDCGFCFNKKKIIIQNNLWFIWMNRENLI